MEMIFYLENMIAYFNCGFGNNVLIFFKHFHFISLLKETKHFSRKAKELKTKHSYLHRNIFQSVSNQSSKNNVLYKPHEIYIKLLWQLYFLTKGNNTILYLDRTDGTPSC